jgi:DNA-binding MarR family transcriptional regulator
MRKFSKKLSNHPKIDDFLCFAIYSAGHAFNRFYNSLLEPLGLTYPQYLVMVALWRQDNQTVNGLGEKVFLESSTLTPLLKRLEAMGHLKRTRNSKDERQVVLMLTKSGRDLKNEAQSIPGCIVDALGNDVEELTELRDKLFSIRKKLISARAD